MSEADIDKTNPTRRGFLRWGIASGLFGVAGCSQGEPAATETPTTAPTQTRTATPEPTPTATPTAKPAEETCTATDPAPPSSEAEWWPMYLHDRNNRQNNQATTGPKDKVGYAWRFETGGAVRSSPAVTGESVYTGSNDGNLYALDLVSGELKWSFETGGPITSSPAVWGEMVFVGSHDQILYALETETGDTKWQFETGGRIRSSPNIAHPSWRDNATLVIGSDDGYVHYFNVKTGEKEFEYGLNGPVVATPYITEWYDTVAETPIFYVHTGSTDSAGTHQAAHLTPKTTSDDDVEVSLNRFEAGAPILSSFTAHYGYSNQEGSSDNNGAQFFGADDGSLHKLSESGSPKFQTEGKVRSSPALSEDPEILFFGSWDGIMYAIEDSMTEEVWRFQTGGMVESSPALTKEAVYIGSGDHHVYGLDAKSGSKLWDFRTGGPVHSSPAVVNGTVFIGSDDGNLYALTTCQ